MDNKLSFNKFATALAALGVSSLTAGVAPASPVRAAEVDAAVRELSEKDDKGQKDESGDKKKSDDAEKKKKAEGEKKKKHGGEEGGCGAGSCG